MSDDRPDNPEDEADPPFESLDEIAERFELPENFSAQAAEMARLEEFEIEIPHLPAVEREEFETNWIDEPGASAGVTSGSSRPRSRLGLLGKLVGHVVFALLGIVAGYYILCWIEPRGNFLDLPLPGIEARPVHNVRW